MTKATNKKAPAPPGQFQRVSTTSHRHPLVGVLLLRHRFLSETHPTRVWHRRRFCARREEPRGKKKSPALKKPQSSFCDGSGLDAKDAPQPLGQNTVTTGLRILTRDSGRWNSALAEKAFSCSVRLPAQRSELCEGPNSHTAGPSGQLQ